MSIEIREIDHYGPAWVVYRDGTKRCCRNEHAMSDRAAAEAWAAVLAELPDGYTTDWHVARRGAIGAVNHWTVVAPNGDRSSKVTDMGALPAAAATLASRTAPKLAVIAAAEAAVREHAEQLGTDIRFTATEPARPAPLPASTGEPLATEKQIRTILRLVARRERNGGGGGFMDRVPTTHAECARLTRSTASLYITSLSEDY